uniref:Signal recognition particle 54 kDa protein n=1 Tax=Stygiella incarcerata TaxID=1712417 RepID=A0A192ZI78_9EUKA|nr:signal recognition particle 54 kDa protein [Stygiella incarcerata]|eukprot:TRINITY_DN3314_c0_g1_i1.p1 TRINITY_DN3314_c0_g1~~TRINITY_DN3314_c0_g1_i1.p1  ORF type:complete len:491 (+),score=146.29 TRINITY_DN3314_c0_g1_i1:198-1670(+)
MVLTELGSKIAGALHRMTESTVIDEEVVDQMVKEIGKALIESDVNVRLVFEIQKKIKKGVDFEALPPGVNKRKLVQNVVFDELCNMLDSGKEPYRPKKGRPNVFMFVGLQGSGKTTTCTKMAYYYQKKGWKAGLVCADTFRAGAFDQLRQNAAKVKVPFYGSYTETDPVQIAREGVEKFKSEKFEIIIVDTSGRHKQEKALFDEMQQVYDVLQPNEVIFVLDGAIGQAAKDQAIAFRATVDVGSVIVTKLDGHAKGGGALSAVAATQCPITFVGLGEHFDQFQQFEKMSFVRRLLGMGDLRGLAEVVKSHGLDKQPELMERLTQGLFSMRDMRDQMTNMMKMGSMASILEMFPGLSHSQLSDADGQEKFKVFLFIMDSMTDAELDHPDIRKIMNASRIARIAKGSGRSSREVGALMDVFKQFQKTFSRMKGRMPRNPQDMQKMIDPRILKQMGGAGGMQNMMRQLTSQFGGMGGMGGMGDLFGGGGGGMG